LRSGRIIADAPIADATRAYLATLDQARAVDLLERTDRRGWQQLVLTGVGVHDGSGGVARTGDPAGFTFRFTGLDRVSMNPAISLRFHLYDELGQPVATLDSAASAPHDSADGSPEEIVCEVGELPLLPGRYRVDVSLRADGHLQDELQGAAWFDVEDGPLQGRAVSVGALGRTTMPHAWRLPRSV
jgi:lipopolysaccharide transport system ATP-binding protein